MDGRKQSIKQTNKKKNGKKKKKSLSIQHQLTTRIPATTPHRVVFHFFNTYIKTCIKRLDREKKKRVIGRHANAPWVHLKPRKLADAADARLKPPAGLDCHARRHGIPVAHTSTKSRSSDNTSRLGVLNKSQRVYNTGLFDTLHPGMIIMT
jgi:hypothetical protein